MTDKPTFEVNFATGTRVDLNEIRRRREAFMPDNRHAWAIQVVYAIDNPDQVMDEMVLDNTNFIGVSPIQCLLCGEPYRGANRFYKCPQTTGARR